MRARAGEQGRSRANPLDPRRLRPPVCQAESIGERQDRLTCFTKDVDAVGRRIRLNEFLQSVSNPAVYAAGDAAAAGPALTPVAGYEGRVVAANLLEGNHLRADYSVVPSVAKGDPKEFASSGHPCLT
jgi:pyruvate/2-oxoglutarate dehydrogenase complex dihydrolipoamide dehydrogenase (E3) component